MKKRSIIIIVAFAILLLSYYHFRPAVQIDNINIVKIAGENIKVELALTAEEQARGLGGRESLREDEGMLFVFQTPGQYYFWMKDMKFPIDIIWLGEDKKVIYIKKNAGIKNPLETYGPKQDSKYVLEVVSGFAESHGIKEGDEARFSR